MYIYIFRVSLIWHSRKTISQWIDLAVNNEWRGLFLVYTDLHKGWYNPNLPMEIQSPWQHVHSTSTSSPSGALAIHLTRCKPRTSLWSISTLVKHRLLIINSIYVELCLDDLCCRNSSTITLLVSQVLRMLHLKFPECLEHNSIWRQLHSPIPYHLVISLPWFCLIGFNSLHLPNDRL